MPNPRTIAEQTNEAVNFDKSVESAYDVEAGAPAGVAKCGKSPDYAANPTNPPEKSSCAKNLK